MCGISGLYHRCGSIDAEELDAFTDALSHRGPDGRGTWIDGEIGFGHRRLSILDLSEAGACPMHYICPQGRRYVITYNGEVYNFIELRIELEKRGYHFKSTTDTEVIVASYAEWGSKCLTKFNGMFAIAIWDVHERELFIARDRFGIKPLYFHNGRKFAFASEIKAFLQLKSFTPQLAPNAASLALQNPTSYEGAIQETLMKDVFRLPSGTYLKINSNGVIHSQQWWVTASHVSTPTGSYEDQVEHFLALLLDSIKLRMRSDVPIGTCLSGGVDSSAITSAITWLRKHGPYLERCPQQCQNAIIATFPGTALNERVYADMVVEDTGAIPHYWEFNQSEGLSHFVDSLWSMEDVYGGIAVPIWCTYREVRRSGLVVTLDGHGADELLCGYPWTLDWHYGDMNNNLYNDFHVGVLPAILRNFDRCSMAHGVEIRTPFLDYRLVCFLFGLGPDTKAGNGFTKRILRDAMKGILVSPVRTRRQKIGFNSPMIEWFNGDLATMIENCISHPLWRNSSDFGDLNDRSLILHKTRNRAWTLEDWGLSLRVWTHINMILWELLFIEQDRASVEKLIFEPSPVSSGLWN